jgi:hypothetical protein
MQISLPNDQRLGERAKAQGFGSVEEYVRSLIERDLDFEDKKRQKAAPEEQLAEDWIRDFQAIFSSLPPMNPNFDDSRESIYPVR